MITREQVADLQAGDVVEISEGRWLLGTVLRGPLWAQSNGTLWIGDSIVQSPDGRPVNASERFLTVISRVPRPLYVNHDRTEPVPGDVVRDADSDQSRVWLFTGKSRPSGTYSGWCFTGGSGAVTWTRPSDVNAPQVPKRLRLLVDGETGQVVP